MLGKSSAIAVLMLGALVSQANAATLNFNEPGVAGIVGSPVNLSNATLTSPVNMFIGFGYGETNGNGIACGAAVDDTCEADWTIDFSSSVSNLSLSSFATGVGDSVLVSAYLGATLLGSVSVTSNGVWNLSGFGVLDRLVFDDSSTDAGIGFGDFSFDQVSPVPIPAALPLLATSIGALGLMGWRRRSATKAG